MQLLGVTIFYVALSLVSQKVDNAVVIAEWLSVDKTNFAKLWIVIYQLYDPDTPRENESPLENWVRAPRKMPETLNLRPKSATFHT